MINEFPLTGRRSLLFPILISLQMAGVMILFNEINDREKVD